MKPLRDEEKPFLSSGIPKNQSRNESNDRRLIFLLVTSLAFSILTNVLSVLWLRTDTKFQNRDEPCAYHIEQHDSPILDDISMTYHTVRFNGSFLNDNIYRQTPSPEVDAAWDAIGANLEGLIIPEREGERYGLDPRQVKRKPEQGGGYVAHVEGFHHIHCLNLLRRSSYFNYEYYRELGVGAFVNDDDTVRKHVGHCLDILRQQLMCTLDTSVFGQWWVKDVGPFVDFNTEHKCKNFDGMYDWMIHHQMSKDTPDRVAIRPGDLILPEIP